MAVTVSSNIDKSLVIQNRALTPVCRIHVYQADLFGLLSDNKRFRKLPISWAGVPGNIPSSYDVPDAIIGKEACYIPKSNGTAGKPVASDWAVLDARVNRTRQWNCSSANFHIACRVEAGKALRRPPVRPNDVVVIEMGYANSHLTRVSQSNGQTDYKNFTGDSVFYGIVDTVKERDGSGATDGVVYTVQARCPIRFLANNKIRANYIPPGTGEAGVNRAWVIRDLLYMGAAIDYVQWETIKVNGVDTVKPGGQLIKGVPGKIADTLILRQPKQDSEHKNMLLAVTGPRHKNSYITLGLIELSTRADTLSPEIADHQEGMRIMDKFPLDVIKHFSLVECSPHELWADPRSGHIHWMARRTDMTRILSGNADTVATRQYFYRLPSDRANILSATQEWSTIGTITHFILTNPLIATSGDNGHLDLYAESPIAYLRDPHTHMPLRSMTTNRFVYDDTLTEADSPRAVVGGLFEIYSKPLMTGMVMVLGDPTLDIGEAVQIHNTGLFGRSTFPTKGEGVDEIVIHDKSFQQDGIFRVEAVQHLFGVGGPSKGYTTVFVYGAPDPDTGVLYTSDPTANPEQSAADVKYYNEHPQGARVIKREEDWANLKTYCLTRAELEDSIANKDNSTASSTARSRAPVATSGSATAVTAAAKAADALDTAEPHGLPADK